MSVNVYKPHLLVLPEDQANRDIVNGFLLYPSLNARNVQVYPNSGGWQKVVDEFHNLIPSMDRFPLRRVILLMDFDGDFFDRSQFVLGKIPSQLQARVFLIGTAKEPECLRTELGRSFEKIGKELAEACANVSATTLWQNSHLQQNQPELVRLVTDVKPFLFC